MDHESHNPLDLAHLFGHVQDAEHFEVAKTRLIPDGKIHVPQPLKGLTGDETLWEAHTGNPLIDNTVAPLDLHLTKFMVLEVIAALLIGVVFIRLANKMAHGDRLKGAAWNMLEAMLVYIRNEVARPAIGGHDADRFVPLLWTMFFFVLVCNLLGLVPWAGSATGALATTGALALVTFCHGVGSAWHEKVGLCRFLEAQVPHMDVPFGLSLILVLFIFAIELLGLVNKHFVLAVRLLANMFAGHLVVGTIIAFIAATSGSLAWWGVMRRPASWERRRSICWNCLWPSCRPTSLRSCRRCLLAGMAVHPH